MGWQTFLKTCRLGGLEIVISLRRTLPTQVTRQRGNERTHYIIQNWLRNRNTIEFLGIWEQLNNPNFNPIEFDGIRRQAERIKVPSATGKQPSNECPSAACAPQTIQRKIAFTSLWSMSKPSSRLKQQTGVAHQR